MNEAVNNRVVLRFIFYVNAVSCIVLCTLIYLGCVNIDKFDRDTAAYSMVVVCLLTLFYNYRDSKKFLSATFSFPVLVVLLFCVSQIASMGPFVSWTVKNLNLNPDILLRYHLETTSQYRNNFFQQYGRDVMFYRREPGSLNRLQIDNGTEGLQEVALVADETGFLNRDLGFYENSNTIDIFFSGDSVLEGAGEYSSINVIKKLTKCSIWNLSTGGYSPRQRCAAIIEFALRKNPKLIVLDVYSGNDFSDANVDELVQSAGHYTASFDLLYKRYLAFKSDVYRDLLKPTSILKLSISNIQRSYVSLALINNVYQRLHVVLESLLRKQSIPKGVDSNNRIYAQPSSSSLGIKQEGHERWVELGIQSALKSYKNLLDVVRSSGNVPQVVFMYNPTSYEIYKGYTVEANPENDRRAARQVEAIRNFCHKNGVIFIDMTGYFREFVSQNDNIWLYGANDPIHWSRAGNVVAGNNIFKALMDNGVLQSVGCDASLPN